MKVHITRHKNVYFFRAYEGSSFKNLLELNEKELYEVVNQMTIKLLELGVDGFINDNK